MGQVLHGGATTTAAVRRAIQHSQESLRALARRYGVNPKTIAKWKGRTSAADLPTGPKEPRSTVLSLEEEAMVVAFRRHTLLPLDDCLYALQPTIPHLTRSSLHRCLQRHGISRLPQVEGEASPKRKFKPYPIGYFHIDIAEVRTAQGRLYLMVAIDRTSKFAFVELHRKVTRKTAADFLHRLIEAVPYRVHTVLTDNGTHFTDPAGETWSPAEIKQMIANRQLFHAHAFEYACALKDINHRLTKPKHPWTNGQVERMNRTIKDATVKRYFYQTHNELRAHLRDFVEFLLLQQDVAVAVDLIAFDAVFLRHLRSGVGIDHVVADPIAGFAVDDVETDAIARGRRREQGDATGYEREFEVALPIRTWCHDATRSPRRYRPNAVAERPVPPSIAEKARCVKDFAEFLVGLAVPAG